MLATVNYFSIQVEIFLFLGMMSDSVLIGTFQVLLDSVSSLNLPFWQVSSDTTLVEKVQLHHGPLFDTRLGILNTAGWKWDLWLPTRPLLLPPWLGGPWFPLAL